MASKKDESVDTTNNTCVVCFKGVDIYSIGQCDHPVCFECSTRMRVLCRQNECPICRQDMPKVIFTKCVRPFNTIKNGNFLTDYKFKISFETQDEASAFEILLAHECPKCKKVFSSFTQLRDHVRRTHLLNYCDLCVENLKILSRERRCYTRQELATHRRLGDSDDRSHRGHPLCEFCDTRYMDNDELYRHLRRDHLYCHFCDADGLHQYYSTYDFLREHFRNEHYLCEEGDCYNEKFTAVFRTDIDYKAHKTIAHGKGLGKAGLKQARTLDIEFTLAPRPRIVQRNRHYREDDVDAGAIGGGSSVEVDRSNPPERCSNVFTQLNTNCIEEFPSLGGNSTGTNLSGQMATTAGGRYTASSVTRRGGCIGGVGTGGIYDVDFPALGPETTQVSLKVNSERPASAAAKQTSSSNNTNRPSSTNVSIQVNHPRFVTTVTSHNTYNYHFPALDSGTSVTVPSGTSTSVHWTSKRSNDTARPPPTTHHSQQQGTVTSVVASGHDPPPGLEDFPALAPTTNNNNNNNNKTASQVTCITTNKISSSNTSTSTASTTNDQQPTLSTSKTKKKKSKSKNTNAVPAENVSLKELEGNNKKKGNTELKNSGDSINSPATSKKKAKENLVQTNSEAKTNNSNNINNNNSSNRKVLKSPKLENVKANQLNHIEKKEEISKPVQEKEKNGQQESIVEKKKGNIKSFTERAITADLESFPALGGSAVPPGFQPKWKVKRPPPGLEKPVNLLPVAGKTLTSPPPGFNSLNGFPSLGNETDSTKLQLLHNNYIMPLNFAKRNSALVTKMTTALGPEPLELFKQVSFSFRSGNIPPFEYYTTCRQIMGPNTFSELFPELLALLPDIEKQQELWTVYKVNLNSITEQEKQPQNQQSVRTSSKKKGGGSTNKGGNGTTSSSSSSNINNASNNYLPLEVCATCYQVLTSSDLREHLTCHALDNHFPALDSQNSSTFNNNAWVQHNK